MRVSRSGVSGPGLFVLLVAFGCAASRGSEEQAVEAFLRNVYRAYETGEAPSPTGPFGASIFTPELFGLIRRDHELAHGELGALNHDPICGCQDYDALTDVEIVVAPVVGNATHAAVSFRNGSHAGTVGFELVRVDRQWRIADVEEPDMSSLRKFLEGNLGGAAPPPARMPRQGGAGPNGASAPGS